jgi:hypothetical protein
MLMHPPPPQIKKKITNILYVVSLSTHGISGTKLYLKILRAEVKI